MIAEKVEGQAATVSVLGACQDNSESQAELSVLCFQMGVISISLRGGMGGSAVVSSHVVIETWVVSTSSSRQSDPAAWFAGDSLRKGGMRLGGRSWLEARICCSWGQHSVTDVNIVACV